MLRALKLEDVDGIFEWMTSPEINKYFRFDSKSISTDSIKAFIKDSWSDDRNLHLAIVDDQDMYLGTISLKNIDFIDSSAEYAISLRSRAIGTNVAFRSTYTILYIAFKELNLNKVYLNVLSNNLRAIRFYEKFGFIFDKELIDCIEINGKPCSLKWFYISEHHLYQICNVHNCSEADILYHYDIYKSYSNTSNC